VARSPVVVSLGNHPCITCFVLFDIFFTHIYPIILIILIFLQSIALVNMDDEEDFELEALSDNGSDNAKNEKWPWLTLHLFAHVLLIILAHAYESWIFSLTAMYSQVLFLVLFLKAKALGDSVSQAVSVVRIYIYIYIFIYSI